MKTPLEALNALGDSSSLDETERNNLETIIRSAIKEDLKFDDWVLECIEGNRFLKSLLYDLNILPECVRTEEQMFKMESVVHHFMDAMNDTVEKKEETDPIIEAVCAKLQSRSAIGIKKYGTTLANSTATVREKLIHAQEEAMDLANYIEWLLQEKEMPTPMTIEMENETVKNSEKINVSPDNVDTVKVSDADRKAALDALNEMEANEYWRRGDYSENIAIIRSALSAPRVPLIEGLDDAIESCVLYPMTNEIGFLNEVDRDNVLKAARAYAELQKGV